MVQSAWTGSIISLISKLCSSSVTAKSHGQVNYLDLEMSLQRLMSWTGTTLRLVPKNCSNPTASWATSTPTYPLHPSIDATWMLKKFLRLLSPPELWRVGGRIFYHYLYSRAHSVQRSYRRVSSTNSFKRSQAARGMSLRKVTLLGSNLASVTDLKRIETPHSLCCDFGGYKTFATRWSGGTVQVWVQSLDTNRQSKTFYVRSANLQIAGLLSFSIIFHHDHRPEATAVSEMLRLELLNK